MDRVKLDISTVGDWCDNGWCREQGEVEVEDPPWWTIKGVAKRKNDFIVLSSLYSYYRHKLNRLWKFVLCWALCVTDLGQRIKKCSINTVLYCIQYIIICYLLTEVTYSIKRIWLMHLYNGSINTSPYAIHVCSITYMYSINFMFHHLLKLWQHRIKEYTLCIKIWVSLSYFMIEYSRLTLLC